MASVDLGTLLSQKIAKEKRAAEDSAAAYELLRTEEARRKFKVVQEFFTEARTFFEQGIINSTPSKELFLQVGGQNYSICDNYHEEVNRVIEGWNSQGNQIPVSITDPKKFGPLWNDFLTWAASQRLEAKWEYCYDGGGMSSWWQLRVYPAKKSGWIE